MAAVNCPLSEDQFLCSICLEVFTDPVTTSCGHSFCKICIKQYWDNHKYYHCPVCKKKFKPRPQLNISTVLSEMVSVFKNKRQRADAEPETSELNRQRKKRHLMTPVENTEERTCPKHKKTFIELFCKDHSQLICAQCFSDHKSDNIVSLKDQCEEERSELQQKIQKRREKLLELQRSVELSQKNADREMKEGIKIFSDLMKCVQESLDQFKEDINKKHQEKKIKTEELIKKLKSEISALEQKRTQMEKIWRTDNHFHFVQTFTLVKPDLQLNDWTEVFVRAPSYEGRVTAAVSEMLITKLNPKIKELFAVALKQVKKHAVEVTLDPDTAHRYLDLSQNYKQVQYTGKQKTLPDNPERFSYFLFVLGKQKFSSGKFYFEVQVKGKTSWWLGVATESIERKNNSASSQNGLWVISKATIKQDLWSTAEKVGVFVDYDEGLVCFFDADTSAIIDCFTDCCFTENILPLLSPGNNDDRNNSAPLIITPVNL